MMPRLPITENQIAAVVAEFYTCIRGHPALGPVFAAHVNDWPSHEEKITRFWKNAILHERQYDGNPMAVHRAAGNIRLPMFPVWLGLFDAVLDRQLPAELAQEWSRLAHRIGQALMFGMQAAGSGPPSLR